MMTYSQLMVAVCKAESKHNIEKHNNSFCNAMMKSANVSDGGQGVYDNAEETDS